MVSEQQWLLSQTVNPEDVQTIRISPESKRKAKFLRDRFCWLYKNAE